MGRWISRIDEHRMRPTQTFWVGEGERGPIFNKPEKLKLLLALIIWGLGIYPLTRGILLLEQGEGALGGLFLVMLKFSAYLYFFALWPIYGLINRFGRKK